VAERFNSDESLKKFIPFAQELDLLPFPVADGASVASLLKTTPGLDKAQVGQFIGKGPPDKYPLHATVSSSKRRKLTSRSVYIREIEKSRGTQ
jgi:brefeldin A-resistance guanine nucleotide exchange factor 1